MHPYLEGGSKKVGIFMGVGCRLLVIDDDDSIQHLSVAWLDRLLRFDEREIFPRYAGKKCIRCALAVLEVAGRQVLTVRHIDYFILPFDAKGRIDEREWSRGYTLRLR